MADSRTFVTGRVYFGKFAGEPPTLKEILDMEDVTDYVVMGEPTRRDLVLAFIRSLGLNPSDIKTLTLTGGNIEVEEFVRGEDGRSVFDEKTYSFATVTYDLVVD